MEYATGYNVRARIKRKAGAMVKSPASCSRRFGLVTGIQPARRATSGSAVMTPDRGRTSEDTTGWSLGLHMSVMVLTS
ncbi:MAG: hypothetical protein ABSH06_10890 [Thermodesulfobacteriota bacterium]